MISILSIGIGNKRSVLNMFSKLGVKAQYVSTPEQVRGSSKLIIPGVGNFGAGMKLLSESGLDYAIKDQVSVRGIPVLGICLGMQLLCKCSEEGATKGLGLIDAKVVRFRFSRENEQRVPHIGWNIVTTVRDNTLLPYKQEEQRYYFAHSYHVQLNNSLELTGVFEYGGRHTASFQADNIFGVQFHPEKSHRFGMGLLEAFARL